MSSIPELKIDAGGEADRIASFICSFVDECGAGGVVLGLSGGLDSSVTAALCVRAISPDRVKALLLPERDSSPASVEDARSLAEKLGIEFEIKDLTTALEELGCYESGSSNVVRFKGGVRTAVSIFPRMARRGYLANLTGGGGRKFREFQAFFRMKHRLRTVAAYKFAEENNLKVACCANRTEFETGFFVRYGDDAGDIAPIKHLYKTQVSALGGFLSIPECIMKKKPSPDLFAGMEDEKIMGISYEELDSILWGLSNDMKPEEMERAFGVKRSNVHYVIEMKERSGVFRAVSASLPPVDGNPAV